MQQANPFDQFDTAPTGPQVVVPIAQSEVAQDAAQLAATQAGIARTRQQLAQDAATAPYAARTAAAGATKAEIDAEKARRELAAEKPVADPALQKRLSALADDEILSAIARARSDLGRAGSAGFAARLPERFQPQSAIDLAGTLNTIASRLTLDKLAQLKQASPTGASGLGSLTEREGALLRDSVAGLGQMQSPERLEESLAAVERHYRNYRALAAGEDYRDPQVAAKYGIAAEPEPEQARTFATGGTREEADPALKGLNSHIRGMIGAGRSAAEITAYMNSVQPGLGDQRAGDVAAATRFRAQNPTVPLDRYAISVENRAVPLSGQQQFINQVAQSPTGTYFLQAGDALTAGTLDNMTDNPALARASMSAAATANPKAAFAGTLSGGALAGTVAEAAGAGLVASRAAPIAADLLYGAAYGAGSTDEGSRLEGAGLGAVTGLAGGEIGRRATGMFGRGLRGVQNDNAKFLRERGVPLTYGQIRGGKFKTREDQLTGYAGVGNSITDRRLEGVRAFNRAAFDEGLDMVPKAAPVGIGEPAVAAGRALFRGPNGAYARALDGANLVPDTTFASDVSGALASGTSLPRVGPEFGAFVDRSVAPHFSAPNGQIDGRQVQDLIQQTRGADFGTDSMGALATDATRRIEGAVMDLAERQAPGAMEALGQANTGYRNLNILADSVGRGINTEGLFTPAQLGMAARANTTRFGGKIAAATPDRPFYELQRAGQEVLPSKVPESGTAGRIEQNGGLAAAVRTATRNLVNAPLYAEGTQGILGRALLDRPDAIARAGAEIVRRARYGGMFGRPLALSYGPTAVVSDY